VPKPPRRKSEITHVSLEPRQKGGSPENRIARHKELRLSGKHGELKAKIESGVGMGQAREEPPAKKAGASRDEDALAP
jgi:hypothetical protein